jgi:putative transposase
MARSARKAPGGFVFHVLNRGVGRRELFSEESDYAAFERVLETTIAAVPVRVLAYCLLPNHWHLLLWPRKDGDLAAFMQRLTTTHVRRFQKHHDEVGLGHIYQGRFKSFPVQEDRHFLTVARYVERNALRANLTSRAERWQWGSLWGREHGTTQQRELLSEWPVLRPPGWTAIVNRPQTEKELAALRLSVKRGRPFGDASWQKQTADRLGLGRAFRDPGRPKKAETRSK